MLTEEFITGCIPQGSNLDEDVVSYIVEMCSSAVPEGNTVNKDELKEEIEDMVSPFLESSGFEEDTIKIFCQNFADAVESEKTKNFQETVEDEDEKLYKHVDKNSLVVDLPSMILGYGARMLLTRTHFYLKRGHKYALVGQNGAGKTTLMTRMGNGDIGGWPTHLKSVYVKHEVAHLEDDVGSSVNVQDFMKVKAKEHGIDESKVLGALNEVGFQRKDRLTAYVSELSGGWKMRLALATALLQNPDILLLDEPTNHLDQEAVNWLIKYLNGLHSTVVVVSHDAPFLNAMCTDVCMFHKKQLKYFEDIKFYDFQKQEQALFPSSPSKFEKSATPSEGSDDDEPMFVEDTGNQSEAEEGFRFRFPRPGNIAGVSSRTRAILKIEKVFFRYDKSLPYALSDINCKISLNSKIAISGPNGAGKSTLLKLIVGETEAEKGTLTKHEHLRISYIAQHSMRHLEEHVHLTPINYIQERFRSGQDEETLERDTVKLTQDEANYQYRKGDIVEVLSRVKKHKNVCYQVKVYGTKDPVMRISSTIINEREKKLCKAYDERLASEVAGVDRRPLTNEEILPHLEDFGLNETFAKGEITRLSGGQCSKLVLAAAMWKRPHVIVLDEPTNYIDMETMKALIVGLKDFRGAVIIVSHNDPFMQQICNERWTVDDGILKSTKMTPV